MKLIMPLLIALCILLTACENPYSDVAESSPEVYKYRQDWDPEPEQKLEDNSTIINESEIIDEQNIISETLVECEELASKLSICEQYLCEISIPNFNETIIREILALQDDICYYTESRLYNMRVDCAFSENTRKSVSDYYRLNLDSESNNALNEAISIEECILV